MSGEALTIAQRTLQHRLADVPQSALPHIRMGFSLLDGLTGEQLEAVVNYVVGNFSKRARYDPALAAQISGVPEDIVGDLLSAIALTVGSIFDIDATSSDFFELAPKDLIDGANRTTIEKAIDVGLAKRDKLKADFSQSKVANSVLPSFRSVEHAIDIRLKYDDADNIVDQVPIAVFFFETDAGKNLWFQVSEGDLAILAENITRAQQRIKSCRKQNGDIL